MEAPSLAYPKAMNYIGGRTYEPTGDTLDVLSPLDGSVISAVPLSDARSLDMAVEAARAAFPAWSGLTLKERTQVFYRLRALLERDIDSLSQLVHVENGKTLEEARAEILKGVELCEFACSLPALVNDEIQEVSKG